MARLKTAGLVASAVSGLVLAGLAPIASASGNVTTPTTATSTTSTRTVSLHASRSTFPKSADRSGGGATNLTESGTLQRYSDQSLSARPSTRTNNAGNRVYSTATPSWLPVVTSSAVNGSAKPDSQASWRGLNEYANQVKAGFSVEPPDQGLCAANGHVLELINDVVRVYDVNGKPQTGIAYL